MKGKLVHRPLRLTRLAKQVEDEARRRIGENDKIFIYILQEDG